MSEMQVIFLEDGRQPVDVVVNALSAFINEARISLDIALYDSGLTGEPAATISSALNQAAARGVAVRFAYYQGPHHSPVIAPPKGTSADFVSMLETDTKGITGFQSLMHQKYAIRDWQGEDACVWTGSCNWTNDSWTREENVILQIPSGHLAAMYTVDFDELWSSGSVDDSGGGAGGNDSVQFQGADVPTQLWFSPSEGETMALAVAVAIRGAKNRISISSPVLTDGPILGALLDVVQQGDILLSGVYDATQMSEVRQQWASVPANSWKIEAWERIVQVAHLAGKHSTPYGPGTVHDYMHLKAIVIDDLVFTGSYNFSRSGETNAENLLRFQGPALAEVCAAFIGRLAARYAD